MTLLAIESSCDDCAAAVLSLDAQILSNIVYTQTTEHEEFGGVVPEVAARSHVKKIAYVVDQALKSSNQKPKDITHIAVTTHPGLIGSLLVGAMFAKGFAQANGCKIIGINHLEGHLLAGSNNPDFPTGENYVALIVSGGHTALYLKSANKFEILGETRDDAAGEAFDKVGKMLGLGYPAGKIIDEMAEFGDDSAYDFPRALKDKNTYDYSFSGLKTSVRYLIRDLEASLENSNQKTSQKISKAIKQNICASMRKAVVEALLRKALLACKNLKINNVVFGGGVVANSLLRQEAQKLADKNQIKLFLPERKYCTDNAVMIALAGLKKFKEGKESNLFELKVSSSSSD